MKTRDSRITRATCPIGPSRPYILLNNSALNNSANLSGIAVLVAAIWLAMPYAAPADDGGKGSSGTDKQISAKTIVGDWLLDEEVARERLQKAMSSNPSAARVYL